MTQEQAEILAILAATVALFLWGRWRHDVVALSSLLVCVIAGLVPAGEAFSGFGHPAVVTVACVLILSSGLQETGAVNALARHALPAHAGPMLAIASITALGAVMSAFMNNVGAMALLMPLAIQIAKRLELPPGKVLMPLSFGTILGGMTTLIGTPPNLIVSGFREQAGMGSFAMFDFTPAGLVIAVGGIIFVASLGWRIVPSRNQKGVESFETGTYLTEARVMADSTAAGKTLREVDDLLAKSDGQIVAMIRNNFRINAPNSRRVLAPDDILVIEAEPESLLTAISLLGLELEERSSTGAENGDETVNETRDLSADQEEIVLRELVVRPGSMLIGRSASDVQLRTRFNLNLLAISRQGRRSIKRLRSTVMAAGDVLLMQGAPDSLSGFAAGYGCLPLAERELNIPNRGKALIAVAVMALAVGSAAIGLFPADVSFAAGVALFMLLGVIPLGRMYQAVDWPVIVLLAALIPVAVSMETTGAADLAAQSLLGFFARDQPVIALILVLVLTMTLSDFMNNAATAAVMCPISISIAEQLGCNPDTFLMAVAIGASCAFLTPIGHQNNTLILGPGGFRFTDYWKLGLPMELLILALGIPMLLLIWPL